MAQSSAYYARYTDDLAKDALAVTGSAEVSAYGPLNLIREGARPAKLSTTTGSFVLEFSGPIAPEFAMLAYQYLDAGLGGVKIQGNATNSWGAPSFEATITIPAKRLDGPADNPWTINTILELSGVGSGYKFWRLVFENANSQNIVIGRLFLFSTLRRVDILHASGPFNEEDETMEIDHETDLGISSGNYPLGGPRRMFGGFVVGTDLEAGSAPVQDAADFRALHESSNGRQHAFMFARTLDDPWVVKFTSPKGQRSHEQGGYQVWPFDVREESRGLPFP